MIFNNIVANNLALSNSQMQDLKEKDNISCTHQAIFQHSKGKGYAVIFRKSKNSSKQFSIPCNVLADRIQPMVDTFGKSNDVWISQNTFYKKNSRRVEDVYQLCNVFSDIDCHKLGLTPYQAYEALKADYFGILIPTPSIVIFSGRGLQLIWRLEPESLYSLPTWQVVQDYICNILKPLGADPQATDAARVLRVAGTYNQKNNAMVEVEYLSDYAYSLTEIIREYIIPNTPEQPVKPAYKPRKATTKGSKVKYLLNIYTLVRNRMLDLQTLIELRSDATPKAKTETREWGRQTLLFLYRYYACLFLRDPKESLKQTLELNKKFKLGLSTREVVRATRSAEKMYLRKDDEDFIQQQKKRGYLAAGYNYKNTTLIKLLEITPEEQKHLKAIIGRIEKEHRRTERNRTIGRCDRRNGQSPSVTRETYLSECANAIADNVAKAKELRKQGMSQRAIAKELGVSQSSIRNYCK